jgi:stearoyl-CoA desaturase (delta-9 desaturase)
MAWIPFWAAGVVNGVGHFWGYRNFACPDTSTNVFPWGILIGGEELHNNHHAFGSSAKFSSKWYEIDIGWAYILGLKALGLVQIKKVAPKLRLEATGKTGIDQRTLQGVIAHRYEILARYTGLMKTACRDELARLQVAPSEDKAQALAAATHWLGRGEENLAPAERARIDQAISLNESLSTMVQMRYELVKLWDSSTSSSEQLLDDLQAWCQRAQQSGIASLEEFALRLRRYAA